MGVEGAPTDNQLASRGSHCPLQGNCRCETASKGRIPEKQPPSPPKKCSLRKLVLATDISPMQRPPEPNYKGASQVTPSLPLSSPPLLLPCRDRPEQVVKEEKDGDRKTVRPFSCWCADHGRPQLMAQEGLKVSNTMRLFLTVKRSLLL